MRRVLGDAKDPHNQLINHNWQQRNFKISGLARTWWAEGDIETLRAPIQCLTKCGHGSPRVRRRHRLLGQHRHEALSQQSRLPGTQDLPGKRIETRVLSVPVERKHGIRILRKQRPETLFAHAQSGGLLVETVEQCAANDQMVRQQQTEQATAYGQEATQRSHSRGTRGGNKCQYMLPGRQADLRAHVDVRTGLWGYSGLSRANQRSAFVRHL